MHGYFFTYTNVITYLGFNLAIFAFLSQYLTFPKDLLSELSRMKRKIGQHEYPYLFEKNARITYKNGSKSTNENQEGIIELKAALKMKVFFLEIDTCTFATLIYILVSCMILALLLIYEYFNWMIICTHIIPILSIVYVVLVYSIIIYLGFLDANRKWPETHRGSRNFFLITLLIYTIAFTIAIFYNIDYPQNTFVILILGLIAHLVLYVIPIALRSPITQLVLLWENLSDEYNEHLKNNEENKKSAIS